MRKTHKLILKTAVLVLCLCVTANSAAVSLKSFNFNEDKALKKWKSMILNSKVEYTLVKDGDEGYVRAVSEKACSAIYYRIGFRLRDYPFFKWKWRILKFPDTSVAVSDEERDDYAARVYLIFPFLSFSSSKFLEYIWSEDLPVGTILDSPSGSNVKLIVVRSGYAPEGEWISETRNAYEDYIKAFGRKPSLGVGAVAIMCDADSSGTIAEALFDDIEIVKQEGL